MKITLTFRQSLTNFTVFEGAGCDSVNSKKTRCTLQPKKEYRGNGLLSSQFQINTERGLRPDLNLRITRYAMAILGELLLTSPSLSFLVCKMGGNSTDLNRLVVKIRRENAGEALNLATGTRHALNEAGQCSCSVVSDSLRPHESQHARPPCPSPTPRVHSDSRPLSQ